MSFVRYISHADVVQDPEVPVPQWGLSRTGRKRVEAMLAQPWIGSIGRVICSNETKSLDAAGILADRLGIEAEVRPATGETDRSATGWVPHDEHERLADEYFAHPHESARGWERSIDSQSRIVAATADLFTPEGPDVAIVGHGGVGTLLLCHLAAIEISRAHDQPRQGHYWSYDRKQRRVLHRWHPIDDLGIPRRLPEHRP